MRSLSTQENVDAPDGNFIYGRIRDYVLGTPGTPVNEALYGDIHQFFARLMQLSGVTPNNLPDNDYNGFQIFEALTALYPLRRKVIEIGSWNMDTTSNLGVAHGLDLTKIRNLDVLIQDDTTANRYKLNYSNTGADIEGNFYIQGTLVRIFRRNGGLWDNVGYSDTGINRGWIIIDYIID